MTSQNVKMRIKVKLAERDCRTCAIRGKAERLGLCSWCVSLVQEIGGGGGLWIYKRGIADDQAVDALPKDLLKPPALLLIE